jgi:hypothetical protein
VFFHVNLKFSPRLLIVLFTDLKLGIIVAHIEQIASIAEGLSREAGSWQQY